MSTLERFAPDLRGTRRETIGNDLLAGLTVAAIAVPQAIAYALVAGLPPQMGLIGGPGAGGGPGGAGAADALPGPAGSAGLTA